MMSFKTLTTAAAIAALFLFLGVSFHEEADDALGFQTGGGTRKLRRIPQSMQKHLDSLSAQKDKAMEAITSQKCRAARCRDCEPGFEEVFVPTECCPICKPAKKAKKEAQKNCGHVRCRNPDCRPGMEKTFTPPGECCPQCEPIRELPSREMDCSRAMCPEPYCTQGFERVVPEGECCPVCEPVALPKLVRLPDDEMKKCTNVRCAMPRCTPGSAPVIPEGECCPECQSSGVLPPPLMPEKVAPEEKEIPERCLQRKEVGRCRSRKLKYYFNPKSGKCEHFFYGGCDGNDNRFNKKKNCEKTCLVEPSPPAEPEGPRSILPKAPLPAIPDIGDFAGDILKEIKPIVDRQVKEMEQEIKEGLEDMKNDFMTELAEKIEKAAGKYQLPGKEKLMKQMKKLHKGGW